MAHDNESVDVQEEAREVPFFKSGLEDIDLAMFNYFDKRVDVNVTTNKGFKKVPVIWAGAERAHSAKREDIERTKRGDVVYPIIVIERGNIVKDLAKKVLPYAALDLNPSLKGGTIEVNRVIKQDKTSNFLKADSFRQFEQEGRPMKRGKENNRVVYETITLPIPVYIEIDYKIMLRTEYQQQMNEMLTPMIRSAGSHKRVMIGYNGNAYEAFFDDNFTTANNISDYQSNERKYETTFNIKVLGYLIGDGKNQRKPRVVRRENPVKVRFPRERVMIGDIDDVF